MGIQACFNYLKNPSIDDNPVLVKRCYSELKFPTFKRRTGIDLENLDAQALGYFQNLFPGKVNILPRIYVQANGEFLVPKNLLATIQDNISSSTLVSGLKTNRKARFQLIPLLIETEDSLNNIQCYQAILHDLREDSWEIFTLPGSHCDPDRDLQIEQRLIKLLTQRLKLPFRMFYQNIRFRPEVGTEADLWWSSYLIYLKMKNVERYRETRVAHAFADVLQNSAPYKEFVQGFRNYLE